MYVVVLGIIHNCIAAIKVGFYSDAGGPSSILDGGTFVKRRLSYFSSATFDSSDGAEHTLVELRFM